MTSRFIPCALLLWTQALLGAPGTAGAAIETYSDRAAWEAAAAAAGLAVATEAFAADPGTLFDIAGVEFSRTGVHDAVNQRITNFGVVSAVVVNFTGGEPVHGLAYDFGQDPAATAFTTLAVRDVLGTQKAINGFLAQGDHFVGVISDEPLDTTCGAICLFGPEARVTGLDIFIDDFAVATEPPVGDCANGSDDDGDGLLDFPDDPGCSDAADLSERDPLLPCDDGADNDGDGGSDFDPVTFADPGNSTTAPAGSGDPGCKDPTWSSENPACNNGENDDDDAHADYDGGFNGPPGTTFGGTPGLTADSFCADRPWAGKEKNGCGMGFEAALLLPLLLRLRRRGAQRRP